MTTQLVHKRFRFPNACDIGELVMRETNGLDEQKAAMFADARGDRSSILQELVRISIVEVDGERVLQPYDTMDTWNSRTRALVMKAYESLNELQDTEVAAFLSGGETVLTASEPTAAPEPPENAP